VKAVRERVKTPILEQRRFYLLVYVANKIILLVIINNNITKGRQCALL
jgi:hypothetical protein